MKLDRFDRQLLALVQENADRTAEQLTEQVALSPSAIQRRLRRLREERVIARYAAIVDPKQVGRPEFFIVALSVERERPELLSQLHQWLCAHEHVQEAFYVTGEADFIIIVTAPDTQTYEAIMRRMVAENPNIARYSTSVALGLVKRDFAIPIPLGDD
jgi:Lrp/AsnC family leucine-responsive transcriptional regulator